MLYYNYPEEYIEIFARDVIQCLLNDEEEILLDEESKANLSLIFAEILEKVKFIYKFCLIMHHIIFRKESEFLLSRNIFLRL